MADARAIRTFRSSATRLIGVCGKCGKKLGGGFGSDGNQPLGKMLRRKAAGARGKRAGVRIVTTACLDVCPKDGVVVIDSHLPGSLLVVARRTAVARVCAALDLPLAGE